MNVNGGHRMTKLACCVALAALAASCSSGSPTKKAQDTPAAGGDTSTGGGSVVSGGGFGGGSLALGQTSAALTGAGSGSGLSVRGTATGTVAADQAFVVVVPTPRGGIDLGGGSSVAPADRTTVLNGLAASGVAKADVVFDSDPRTSQPRVQVRLAVNQVAGKGPGIVNTVERTLGRSLSSGVTFSLASCEPAGGPLRKQALQQADVEAKALADAGKMGLGPIVAVRQGADASLLALRGSTAPPGCPLVASGQLNGFDAKPEVTLTVAVDVTYAIAGAPASGSQGRPLLWSLGSATATSKADQAYVVVLLGTDNSDPSAGPSATDRTRLFDALGKLKIDRKDVTVSSGSDYGVTTIVQVETKSAGLATSGKDIVRAVEDVLGHSDTSGARFWSSTCGTLLAKARKDAVADGRKRAGALADAAGVKVGDLQSVSELSLTGIDPCDASVAAVLGSSDYGSPSLQSFDAEPEFTLTTATQLGFLIA
jgi:uncharacterized protein YggE